MCSISVIFIIAAALLTGCSGNEPDSGSQVIAQIGSSRLCREDLQGYLPHNLTCEDSMNLTRRYIDSWALNRLLVLEARRELSKQETDVEPLVEEYRNQLLIYRLENKYIARMLDTTVTLDEKQEYYRNRSSEFKTENGLVKGCMAIMYSSSPLLARTRSLLMRSGSAESGNPEDFLYNTAYKYHNFTENWTDISIVARDMETDTATLLNGIRNSGPFFENNDSVFCRFLYITDFIEKGELSPFEYNAEKITTYILSNRKQKLLADFHRELVNKALDNGELKIADDYEN